jgi:TolB-like protein/Tfp pilus assembly protein PilF
LTDILGVESEIAKRIAESLQAKLTGREEQALAAKPTSNPDAYDAYLRALAFEESSTTVEDAPEFQRKAIGFYERAVQIDPNFAAAWARLSRQNAQYYFGRWDPGSASRGDAAKRALDNAQKLQPESPESLLALGYYQYRVLRDYEAAKATFGRASMMLPNSSEVAHALGQVLRREGHWDESIYQYGQALVLDPRDIDLLMDAASTYAYLRQFPAALKLCDRVMDMMPVHPGAAVFKAWIYLEEGNLREAAKLLENVNVDTKSDYAFGAKITQLRLERNYGEAIRLLQSHLAQFPSDARYFRASSVRLAFMQHLAGDVAGSKVTAEQARNTLEQLYRDQSGNQFFAAFLSLAYAMMGQKDLALKTAEQATVLMPTAKDRMWGPGMQENLALVEATLGENGRAIETLTQLLHTPYNSHLYGEGPITPALLRLDPIWDPLRGDPAFQKLCEEKIDKSIAVLPFENLSGDPNNTYFADGIQEEILTRLAKIADLKVISRTSTSRYKSKPDNLLDIAKQLGVANILEGSVQKAADQVRVNVQLINAQTDSHLWADRYDRKLTDIFGVESEIARRIAQSLQAKLSSREEQTLAVKPTNNPEAYDAYLRGLAFHARGHYSDGALANATDFFEHAVQLDPSFALAWARLSRAQAWKYFHNDPVPFRRDVAKKALDNAQRLEPDSAETLLALGYYQYWVLGDDGLAKTTFQRVSEMLPGSSEVLLALGRVARKEGRWDESNSYFERALNLDPRNVEFLAFTAETYTFLRQFPAALKFYDRALDIVPNDPDLIAAKIGIYQAQGNLKEAAKLFSEINVQTSTWMPFYAKMAELRLERNYDEAIHELQTRLAQFRSLSEVEKGDEQSMLAVFQRLAGDSVGSSVTAKQARDVLEAVCKGQATQLEGASGSFSSLWDNLSVVNAVIGEKNSALKAAERAIMLLPSAKDPVNGPNREEILAVVQTMVGENSSAISALARLLRTPYYNGEFYGTPVTPALLRLDPIWDPLRADPRFQELCQDKLDKSIAVQKAATR